MNESGTSGLRQEVLARLVKAFFSGNFEENTRLIPYDMRPKGSDVPFRCCIYKERAILRARVIAGLGFSIEDDNEETLLSEYAKKSLERENFDDTILTVIGAACKGCVPDRMHVTNICQGCIERSCRRACKFGAVNIINGKSYIDSTKCRNCRMCMSACPYNAIVKIAVPCEDACPADAIEKDESGHAKIDRNKCISCGKCVKRCPFGAINEKSRIIDIMKNIRSGNKTVALIAPSVQGQFKGDIYQLKTAMLKAGFTDVFEVAQGADITAKNEAEEFKSRMKNGGAFMTTSCCAGYNSLRKKHLACINRFASDTKTPVYYIAEIAKQKYPDAKLVFVSPCVAKRQEIFDNKNTDYLMNFIELNALFKGLDINVEKMSGTLFDKESSKQGRKFGITGGVSGAVEALSDKSVQIKPVIVSGLNKDIIKQLKKYAEDGACPEGNLIEVMCCEGGCIGGNAVIEQPRTAKKALQALTDKSRNIEV